MLRYWAVFAAFSSAEFYTDMLISWMPFYFELKMLILLYLSIPFTKGSCTVYEMHMKPWFRAHQQEIDMAIAQLKASMLAAVVGYRDRLAEWAHECITSFLRNKMPAALPLFTMAVALASETLKAFFSQETTASVDRTPTASCPDSAAIPVPNGDSPSSQLSSISLSTPTSSTSSTDENTDKTLSEPNTASSSPALQTNKATHPPMLAQLATAPISKTTPALSTIPPSSSSHRATHKRDTSVPVSASEPKTRGAKKLALQGTAMPYRPKPIPQPMSKKDAIVSLVEEDSITNMSPSKRSNPKLAPSSPLRRSAV